MKYQAEWITSWDQDSWENINNHRYADDTTIMAESKEELKSLLIRVKEESEKAGLKLNIHKTKIMASGPITSWQIEWGTMETVTDCIFLGFKTTVDGDCSHEIKRHLVFWRKTITNLDSVLKKQRHRVADKGPYCQSCGFSSSHVQIGCESLPIKKAKHNWCFWIVVLEKTWESLRLQGD